MVFPTSDTGQAILYFSLSVLIISANLLVVVAVRYMRSAKKATIVFLCQLAVCNLIQGIIFLLKAFFYIWPVQVENECLAFISLSVGTSGAYVTGILYLYLDLFLALRKLSILKPVISTRTAFLMIAVAWVVWLTLGSVGYLFKTAHWDYDMSDGCYLSSGGYDAIYVISLCVLFLVLFVVIMVCHVGTLHVMRRTYNSMRLNTSTQSPANDKEEDTKPSTEGTSSFGRTTTPATGASEQLSRSLSSVRRNNSSVSSTQKAQSKWMKKNMSVMRIVVVVMCIFSFCWYPSVVIVIVVVVCNDCLPRAVVYLSNILIIVQYISNGFIYLAKSREFQEAFKRLFSCCTKKVNPTEGRLADTNNTADL